MAGLHAGSVEQATRTERQNHTAAWHYAANTYIYVLDIESALLRQSRNRERGGPVLAEGPLWSTVRKARGGRTFGRRGPRPARTRGTRSRGSSLRCWDTS